MSNKRRSHIFRQQGLKIDTSKKLQKFDGRLAFSLKAIFQTEAAFGFFGISIFPWK